MNLLILFTDHFSLSGTPAVIPINITIGRSVSSSSSRVCNVDLMLNSILTTRWLSFIYLTLNALKVCCSKQPDDFIEYA